MRSDAGKVPVSPDAPAGTPVREDDRFAQMQQEIDLLTSISGERRQPDWPKLATLGEELLTGVGKDIMVAAWMGAALLRTEGSQGILSGSLILADICSTYWAEMFPPIKRLRARTGAVDWWQDQVEAFLEKSAPEYLPAPVLTGSIDAVTRMEAAFAEAAPDNDLRLRFLLASLRRIPVQEETLSPAAAPSAEDSQSSPAAQAAQTAQAAQATPATPATPAAQPSLPAQSSQDKAPLINAPPSLGDADAGSQHFYSLCSRFLLDAADALLAADISAPASYVFRRTAIWAAILREPPAEGGRTLLPAPPDHILPGLTQLLRQKEYRKVVNGAETQAGAYIYWIDLAALAAAALTALGPECKGALRALEGQTLAFLRRFPAIADMSFDNGQPFAGDAAREWLASLSGAEQAQSPFRRKLAEATAKSPHESLEAIGTLLLTASSGRETLELYGAALTACHRGMLWRPLPHLCVRLLALLEKGSIVSFDPPAAAEALSAAVQALAALLETEPDNTKAREQYAAACTALAGLQPHLVAG